jgi:anti-sigma regulatory factor (Ser/Thr protein kinase)
MANNATWTHATKLLAEPVSASRARVFVSRHLFDHRLPYLVDPIRLAASEMVTNALVHAQTAFTVTLSETDRCVLLAVRDDSSTVPVVTSLQSMDTGGRGMCIIKLLSQDWGVDLDRSGSKTVWASFAMR